MFHKLHADKSIHAPPHALAIPVTLTDPRRVVKRGGTIHLDRR